MRWLTFIPAPRRPRPPRGPTSNLKHVSGHQRPCSGEFSNFPNFMKFQFRTVKYNNFNALISNFMARKLPESITLPKIMISHYMCLTVASNARETRNARLSAGQATKTMRFYIKNHTDSAPPLHDSLTLRPTYLASKGSCAYILRTPLGFPKRLPNKECFAPCK